MPEPDDTASALKNRRAAAKAAPKSGVEQLPPNADVPPEVGANEPARRFPFLRDPREPVVLGQSGMTLGGDHGGKYVKAEVDADELLYPNGCKTPVSRSRWRKGQMVLRTAYEAHMAELAEQARPEPEKAAG